MNHCSQCEGFLPPHSTTCPNCDTTIARSLLRGAAKLAVGAATVITLMACYGGGPDDWSDDDGSCTDQDNDGFCAYEDCDDNNASMSSNCCIDDDRDGICEQNDCDDNDAANVCCDDFDNDGVCSEDDCNDRDASVSEWCEDLCSVATPMEVGTVSGDTVDGTYTTMTCGAGTSDVIYELPVTDAIEGIEAGQLVFVSAEVVSETAHFLGVRDDCTRPDDIACGAIEPKIELIGTTGETFWFVVEAASEVDHGPFELTVDVQPLACGDGQQVGPEECDDGNVVAGDGCSPTCQLEVQP